MSVLCLFEKDSDELWYLTELLSFSLSGHEMLVTENYEFPKLEKDVLQTFYPLLAALIVEDLTRDAVSKERDIPEDFVQYLASPEHIIGRKILLYYTVTQLHHKDHLFVAQLLKTIGSVGIEVEKDSSFIQSLVSELIAPKVNYIPCNLTD